MSPTTNPDFLQQILGQTPNIPEVNTPVPLAEDDLINERQKQLEALDPSNRVANLDPFSRNRRTGTNNTRSKKDKLNTALSYITEFLGAATGGPKYQNPYQRARIEAMEDYKLQAPRLIDELKILNQNKRQAQVNESQQKVAQMKIESQQSIAAMNDMLQRWKTDQKTMTEADKLAFSNLYKDIDARFGKDPLIKLKLQALGTDFRKLENDSGKAQEVLSQIQQDKRGDMLATALSKRIANQQVIKQTPTLRTGMSQYDSSPVALPGISSTKITAPLSNEEQQRARQLFGPLMPSGTNQAPEVQPQNINSPEILPDPKNNQKTIAQRVLSSPTTASPGNVAPVRQKVTQQSVALANDTSTDYDNDWKTEDGRNITAYRANFGPVQELQNKIFNISNENGAVKTPWGIIDDKTFARRGGDKEKKNFLEAQRAVMDTNGIVSLGLKQYIRTGGKLLTGLTKGQAADIDQYADDSLVGKGAKFAAKFLAGRKIDDNDRALAFLTTKTYFDAVYAKTGMQANQFEFQNAKKYQLHTGLGSDAFMFRALVLALAANRKMDRTYEELSTRKTQTNPPLDLDWAVERASKIMDMLQKVKNKPASDRERILQNPNFDALLNPRVKMKE